MKTCIYQICYSQETFENIPAGFLCLNHMKNERPDWRELWPMRNFLKTNELSEDVLYGFLSPKFSQKTLLNHSGVQDFLSQNYAGEDLVSFSPFWDLMALFKNVFEQGDFFHPGLSDTCQKLMSAYPLDLNLANCIMSSQNTIFCNYFLANKKFWSHWLILADYLVATSEQQNTELSIKLNAPTSYGEQQLSMKVFVQERLASLCLLAHPKFRCLNYSPFNIGPSTTPFNQFFHEAVLSDALKRAYVQTNQTSYLDAFASLRNSVIQKLYGGSDGGGKVSGFSSPL
jgi:hypothetical protein